MLSTASDTTDYVSSSHWRRSRSAYVGDDESRRRHSTTATANSAHAALNSGPAAIGTTDVTASASAGRDATTSSAAASLGGNTGVSKPEDNTSSRGWRSRQQLPWSTGRYAQLPSARKPVAAALTEYFGWSFCQPQAAAAAAC